MARWRRAQRRDDETHKSEGNGAEPEHDSSSTLVTSTGRRTSGGPGGGVVSLGSQAAMALPALHGLQQESVQKIVFHVRHVMLTNVDA